MCVQSDCMCLRRITTIKVIFKTWLSWVLACLKQWSYNKTQLPNDQIRCLCQKSLKHAFWRYLKRFRTSFFFWKTMSLKHEFLTIFEKIGKCRIYFWKQWLSSMNYDGKYLKRSGIAEKFLKSMSSDSVWNDLEMQRIMKTMPLKNAFWRYLKQSGTAEKFWKPCLLSMHCDGIWNCRKHENKDRKWWILTGFETIWKSRVMT